MQAANFRQSHNHFAKMWIYSSTCNIGESFWHSPIIAAPPAKSRKRSKQKTPSHTTFEHTDFIVIYTYCTIIVLWICFRERISVSQRVPRCRREFADKRPYRPTPKYLVQFAPLFTTTLHKVLLCSPNIKVCLSCRPNLMSANENV